MAADRSGARRRAVGRPSESNRSHCAQCRLVGKKKTKSKLSRGAQNGGCALATPIDRRGDARTTFARMRAAIYHALPGNTRAAIISTVVAFRAFWPSPTRAKIEEHGCLQLLGTDEWQNASKLSQRGILLNFCVEWCGPQLLARPVPHHLQRVLSVIFFCAAGMANARPFNRWATPRRARTSRQP